MGDIAMGAIFLVVVAGLWWTRNAKGPPPLEAKGRVLAERARQLETGEAFRDERNQDY